MAGVQSRGCGGMDGLETYSRDSRREKKDTREYSNYYSISTAVRSSCCFVFVANDESGRPRDLASGLDDGGGGAESARIERPASERIGTGCAVLCVKGQETTL